MANFDYIFTLQSTTGGTVTLTSSPFTVASYSGSGYARDDDTVGETLEVRIMDGATSANLAELRAINTLFHQAEIAQHNPSTAKVYLTWQEATGGTIWRSEIVKGRADLRNDALMRGYWMGDTTFAPIFIERKNYWEGPEAQLPLTNGNGTDNTSGLAIYNCNDGSGSSPNKRHNYADIAGTALVGDLPAACRLEITNTFNSAADTSRIWIAKNAFSTPASFPHILEGEDSATGTPDSTALCSGGEQVNITWTGATEQKLFAWTLSTAMLNCTRGAFVRAVMRRASSVAATTWVRLKIKASVTTLWSGPLVQLSTFWNLQELCTFRLPPYLLYSGDLFPLTLELWAQDSASGTHGLSVDFIQLSPVDGWRVLAPKGYNLPYQARLVDDGIEGTLYSDGMGATGKFGQYIGYGERITLEPGKDQRLYFLMAEASGGAEITRTASVKLYYRPRRIAL